MHFEYFEKGFGLCGGGVDVANAASAGAAGAATDAGRRRRDRRLFRFGQLFEEEGDDVVERGAAARRHHRLDGGQSLGNGGENVEEDVGFQSRQEDHVVLGKALEQSVISLT